MIQENRVVVVGHPFSTLGMGGQIRGCIAALQSIGMKVHVADIYAHAPRTDEAVRRWLEPIETSDVNGGVRVFHMNGDEIERAIDVLRERNGFLWDAGPTIICPAWELPKYPGCWAQQVNRFSRCWGISRFVTQSLSASVEIPVDWVGQSVDVSDVSSLPRRYFGIRESSHVFLSFFDHSSYVHRKNPMGTYDAFLKAFPRGCLDDVQLVIKVKGQPAGDDVLNAWVNSDSRVKLLTGDLKTLEMNSLLACADTLVSLHRAEGFGRGPAEALIRGKQVIATAYSGTEDYLTDENSFRIPYTLVPVLDGEYPHWEGQMWAQPSLDDAAEAMRICQRDRRSRAGARGALDVLRVCGPRSVGARMVESIGRSVETASEIR